MSLAGANGCLAHHRAPSTQRTQAAIKASHVTQPTLLQILENTPEGHVDHSSLKLALEQAEELCSQVNEGVREKENSDRLEWIQAHAQCEGLAEVRLAGLSWGPRGRLWRGSQYRPSPGVDSLHLRITQVASPPCPLLGCHLPFL